MARPQDTQEYKWLLDEKYGGVQNPAFFDDLKRLSSGEPLAFIIGTMPFLGCSIHLTSRPLIPRPETEFWVNHIIQTQIPEDMRVRVLDVCAGSGCIGVAIAHKRPFALVDSVEIKIDHLTTIRNNFLQNNIETTRFKIIQSDLFEAIPPQTYDYIFANPPYISTNRVDTVDQSVILHEDPLALFSEDDGLFYIKKIILQSFNFLARDGLLAIEFDPWQKDLLEIFLKQEDILNYQFINDQYNKTRVLIVKNTTF